jgi:hypothetical protein
MFMIRFKLDIRFVDRLPRIAIVHGKASLSGVES